MANPARKFASWILVIFILAVTAFALLGIWDIYDIRDIGRKLLLSLTVIFVASAVVLFIFAVVIKDPKEKNEFPKT